ncbi:hypothetical protein H5J25_14850 [Sphingomonas aliaeris]|uniref:Uncharacterized protein n=1 Tax=Sphingomonas aliaeris TaxID=2759526 RepID=A0A974S443_9SPHN|nr:hypothetical protein [Sphingomonas aliaeris]QQV76690.1 hypothetical protein H5J25_14850 [Sphingomonas aliaeris]
MTFALLLLSLQAVPQAAPFDAPVLSDEMLAEQRGGFRLPSGIDVAMTVQTQSAINGAIVLRTVFEVDRGAPNLTIYAPRQGETVSSGAAQGATATGGSAPTVTYDNRNMLEVRPGYTPTLTVASGDSGTSGALPAGLAQVASGATTDAGLVTEGAHGGVRTIELRGADLSITHIAGDAFGSAIANSGSDRQIDTQTSVSINLANAGPDVLGSAMFRVEDVALQAVAMRGQ